MDSLQIAKPTDTNFISTEIHKPDGYIINIQYSTKNRNYTERKDDKNTQNKPISHLFILGKKYSVVSFSTL